MDSDKNERFFMLSVVYDSSNLCDIHLCCPKTLFAFIPPENQPDLCLIFQNKSSQHLPLRPSTQEANIIPAGNHMTLYGVAPTALQINEHLILQRKRLIETVSYYLKMHN